MIPDHLYVSHFYTGSNYICTPPIENTDIDIMYLVYSLEEANFELIQDGWQVCGAEEYGLKVWRAYRKDNYNVLITDDRNHYDRFEAATELAKKRNLLKKEDRINLFTIIIGKQDAKIT